MKVLSKQPLESYVLVGLFFLRNESLPLERGVLLQHFKVVLLVRGVLVDHEDVGVQLGDDESQVELTDDLHVLECVFTVETGKVNVCL